MIRHVLLTFFPRMLAMKVVFAKDTDAFLRQRSNLSVATCCYRRKLLLFQLDLHLRLCLAWLRLVLRVHPPYVLDKQILPVEVVRLCRVVALIAPPEPWSNVLGMYMSFPLVLRAEARTAAERCK
jgi:hypothetical protein